MKKIFLLIVTILLVFCGCSKKDNPVNPNNPTLSGTWKGTATITVVGITVPVGYLDADLSQSGASISGTSTVYGSMVSNDTLNCTVSAGNNNYPNVSFTSTASASGGHMYSLTFTGAFVNSDSLNGSFKDDASGVTYKMGIKKQ